MAAPDLTQKLSAFVQKEGTDDPGANTVGHPFSRLTIDRALLDLADTSRYPAASLAYPHIVGIGPGTFVLDQLPPPFTWFNGSDDGQGQPTTILTVAADLVLPLLWNANQTMRGGLMNCTIQVSAGTPALDLTMPVPVGGNPVRVFELFNVHHNLPTEIFEATSLGDLLVKELCRYYGANTGTFRQTGGTSRFNNVWSNGLVTIIDKTAFPAVGNWDGLILSDPAASLTARSIAAVGTTLRLSNSSVRALLLSQTAPGVLAVTSDVASLPVRSAITVAGTATVDTNLTLLNDAQSLAYTPGTPADWSAPVPNTVQKALDRLGGGGGGSGVGTFVYIVRTGNRSSAAWGVNGVAINDTINTFTDTTSAGAVAGVTATRSFAIPTFASAGGVVYADAVNVYVAGAPVITGGTATRTWSFYVAAGASYFGASVGIGTTGIAPATMLHVVDTGTGTPRGITNDQYNNGTQSAQMNMRKSRGTPTAPTTITTGDILGRLITWGYDGANFIETGNIRVTSTGTIAANRVPSQMEFYTSTDANPSVLTLAWTLTATQNAILTGTLTLGTAGLILNGTTGAQGLTVTGTTQNFNFTGTGRFIFNTPIGFGGNSLTLNSGDSSGGISIVTAATITLRDSNVGYHLLTTTRGGFRINTSSGDVVILNGANTTFLGTITTAAPTAGAAGAWRLGVYSAGVAVQGGTVRINIGGTDRDLLAV